MKLGVLAIISIATLAGCATQAPTGYSTEPDFAKVQAINNAARSQGVQVVWINMPLKVVKVGGT